MSQNGTKNSTGKKEPPKLDKVYVMAGGKLQDADDYFRGPLSLKNLEDDVVAGTKGGESQELRDDTRGRTSKGGAQFIQPPLSMEKLARLLEVSTPHYRAVTAKACDPISRGWTLVQVEDSATEADKERLDNFLRLPSPRYSLAQVLQCALTDFESIGNFSLEVVRENEDGDPTELNHIPVKTVRTREDFKVLVQTRNQKATYFQPFGQEEKVNKDTGETSESLDFVQSGNEMIYMRKYHPKSDWYGIPDILPALGAMSLSLSSRDFNLDFFENNAVPAHAVIIEGGDLTPEAKEYIEDFFAHELKGSGNQHRTIVIPVPHPNVKVTIQPLSVAIKEGHFKNLTSSTRDEILSANGVPPIRAFYFQAGNLGRDTSRELNKIYKDTTVDTLRQMIEDMLNNMIIRTAFKITGWEIRFAKANFDDKELTGITLDRMNKSKAFTVNELRRFSQPLFEEPLEPVEGGDEVLIEVSGQPIPIDQLSAETPVDDEKSIFDRYHMEPCHEHERANVKDAGQKQRIDEMQSIEDKGAVRVDKAFDVQKDLIFRNFNAAAEAPLLKRIFSKQTGQVTIDAVLKDFDGTAIEMSRAVRATREEAGKAGSQVAAERLGIAISFDLQNPEVIEFLEGESVSIGEGITRTMSNRVRNQLSRGILAGESNEQLAKRIEKVFETTPARAAMIARTETADAFNFGTLKGYQQTGQVTSVKVFDVGGPGDLGCISANGATWPIEMALSNRLEHPNCVRDFSPVVST